MPLTADCSEVFKQHGRSSQAADEPVQAVLAGSPDRCDSVKCKSGSILLRHAACPPASCQASAVSSGSDIGQRFQWRQLRPLSCWQHLGEVWTGFMCMDGVTPSSGSKQSSCFGGATGRVQVIACVNICVKASKDAGDGWDEHALEAQVPVSKSHPLRWQAG